MSRPSIPPACWQGDTRPLNDNTTLKPDSRGLFQPFFEPAIDVQADTSAGRESPTDVPDIRATATAFAAALTVLVRRQIPDCPPIRVVPCRGKSPANGCLWGSIPDDGWTTSDWHGADGYGIICGPGLAVLDLDNPAAVALAESSELSPLLIVKTPSGGYHYYFVDVDNLGPHGQWTEAGYDWRGNGKGYVVGPGLPGYAITAVANSVVPPDTALADAVEAFHATANGSTNASNGLAAVGAGDTTDTPAVHAAVKELRAVYKRLDDNKKWRYATRIRRTPTRITGPCPLCQHDTGPATNKDRLWIYQTGSGRLIVQCNKHPGNPADHNVLALLTRHRDDSRLDHFPAYQPGENTGTEPEPSLTRIGEYRRLDVFAAQLTDTGIALRVNTRANRIEIAEVANPGKDPQPAEWGAYTDRRDSRLQIDLATHWRYIDRRFGKEREVDFAPSQRDWTNVVNAYVDLHSVDPFRLWLESLPEWDGTARIDQALADCFPAAVSDGGLLRWASAYPLIAAIERCYRPGAKIDEIPVLVGGQGIGKSAWLRHLLPPEPEEWFGDQLALDYTSKQMAEAIAGRVIVELAEIAGVNTKNLHAIKSFLTRVDDGQHREPYAKRTYPRPRITALVATSNDTGTGILPNDTTNRRFVVVNLGDSSTGPVEPWLAERRDQLWAEALARHQAGGTARLPRRLAANQRSTNAGWTDRNQHLGVYIDRLNPAKDAGLTIHEHWTRYAGDTGRLPTAHQAREFGREMKNNGWTSRRTRHDGTRETRYYPDRQLGLDDV